MKNATKVCITVLLVLTSAIGIWLHTVLKGVEESFAAWNTTKAIAAYIIRNEGELPETWDDLVWLDDPYFEPESIKGYKETIIVTFEVDSVEIQTVSARKPLYNNPNEEIQQVIRESGLPKSERKSFYWIEFQPPNETN